MNVNNFYDIVIVGAGITGLTLAQKLKAAALRIAVVDRQALPATAKSEGVAPRVSALTPAARAVLADLALWQAPLSSFNKMHVWTPSGAALDFNAASVGATALGYVVENAALETALRSALRAAPNITFIAPAQLQALAMNEAGVTLTLDNSTSLTARLVIGADGAHSHVRALSQIGVKQRAYAQKSIVASIALEKPHGRTAWQVFLADGPLAVLPLADPHAASIVWSTSAAHAEALGAQDAAAFEAELSQALDYRFGTIQLQSARVCYPLQQQHAEQYIKPRVALIGDAAHTLHPLAGQGLNLGILDAACLASVIVDAQERGRDMASHATLRKYERARRGDNSLMLTVVDHLQKVFAEQATPLQFLRDTGLDWLNQAAWLKNYLIRQATSARH